MKRFIFLTLLALILLPGGWLVLTATAATETPEYTVESEDGDFEIRVYPDLKLVTTTSKDREMNGSFMKLFRYILDRAELDVILSYNHYTLQNTMLLEIVDELKSKEIGIMNAAPFSARLLTNATLPVWHKATPEVRDVCRAAATHCERAGTDLAKLALQFSIAHPDLSTCVSGSANPDRVGAWCDWIEEPLDETLLQEVLKILLPIHNWFYVECLPENSDPLG